MKRLPLGVPKVETSAKVTFWEATYMRVVFSPGLALFSKSSASNTGHDDSEGEVRTEERDKKSLQPVLSLRPLSATIEAPFMSRFTSSLKYDGSGTREIA
jgi:hypothetical protein